MKDIDSYINSFPQEVEDMLRTIRKIVKEEASDATEVISYKMPAFKLNGKYLVYFAAWKDHIALYPATSHMEVSKDLAIYRTGKGTFQFPFSKPLPIRIIRKIVRIRIKENLADKAKNSYK